MAKKKTTKKTNTVGKRLYRSNENKIIAGVCGGVAEYFNVDPVIIRLIWAVLIFGYGFGLLAYILAWIIVPLKR
jgi:phage shock protein PspC (stress-responsive transcriptional regulator)